MGQDSWSTNMFTMYSLSSLMTDVITTVNHVMTAPNRIGTCYQHVLVDMTPNVETHNRSVSIIPVATIPPVQIEFRKIKRGPGFSADPNPNPNPPPS